MENNVSIENISNGMYRYVIIFYTLYNIFVMSVELLARALVENCC